MISFHSQVSSWVELSNKGSKVKTRFRKRLRRKRKRRVRRMKLVRSHKL